VDVYTTFSAYSLDAALLYERDQFALAAFYVIGFAISPGRSVPNPKFARILSGHFCELRVQKGR
jgi:hypothetical protein